MRKTLRKVVNDLDRPDAHRNVEDADRLVIALCFMNNPEVLLKINSICHCSKIFRKHFQIYQGLPIL